MPGSRLRDSLKRKITLGTLALFIIGIWALSYYISSALREDMQSLLADQQAATVALVAAEINHELNDRLLALSKVAGSIDQALIAKPHQLQQFLNDRPTFLDMFNSGVVVIDVTGIAIADAPVVAGRVGQNYADNAAIHTALNDGKTTIGRPVMGRVLRQPVFTINVPIRDKRGKVIGALFGVINLDKPNFVDRLGEHRYGKSGGYLVMAPQHNLIVTATDKSRVMQPLPPPGANKIQDMRMHGYDGSAVAVNSQGQEILSSSSRIPVAGWYVVATLPTKEAFAPIDVMQEHVIIATILLTLLTGLLIFWLLRRQFSPMMEAVDNLAAMSSADQPLRALPIKYHDEIGQLIGGFNRLLDILGQREAQLSAERNYFSALLQQSSDGVLLFDPDTLALQEANASLCKMLGYERHELLALKFDDLIEVASEAEKENLRRVARQGVRLAGERNCRRKDGDRLPMEMTASRVETGGRQLIMVNLRDVTQRMRERKEMKLELAAYSMKLDQASRRLLVMQEETKRRLAAELHDRTSPNLAAIELNLRNVIMSLPQEQSPESMERLDDTRALIEDTNASIREICAELRPAVLDYAGLAAAVEDYASHFARRTGIAVRVTCSQLERLTPEKESLLFRICQEALTNSAKHAKASAIKVSLSGGKDAIVLTVTDDGAGFDQSALGKAGHASGMGLLNMREMAELSGGQFTIESHFGKGTRIEARISP